MSDEIIRELWRIKDELAREANYDVHTLCQKLRELEDCSKSLDARIFATMGSPQDTRRMVGELAKRDPAEATTLAYTIKDPWYRCQSLAYAASSIQDREEQKAVLNAAFKAAMGAGEPNRVVTVSAWPLRVLVEIEDFDWFDVELDRLLQLITTEPHPIRRSDAVFALLQRGQRAPVASVEKISDALIAQFFGRSRLEARSQPAECRRNPETCWACRSCESVYRDHRKRSRATASATPWWRNGS